MAAEPVIEIEPFLKPIAGDNPAGPDLREKSDADFTTVKTARRKIVSLTKSARFDPSAEAELNEQWKVLRKLAPSVIKKKAKDLEVACWLTECLLKLSGYEGLKDGLTLIHKLLENFWDNLHPMPDEDGLETRIYPLISLNGEEGNGTLVLPIKNAPIFPTDNEVTVTFTSYARIQDALSITEPADREKALADLGVAENDLQILINGVTPEGATEFIKTLDTCISTWNSIGQLVDEKCQEAGTHLSLPVSGVRGAIQEVKELYEQIMRDKLASQVPEPESTDETSQEVGSTQSAPAAGTMQLGGPMHNRDDAIRQLKEVADFFRRAEPHSPMSGILERAVQWSRLPLEQLLAQLIPDATARMHYSLMTGIEIGEDLGTAIPISPPTASTASSPAAPASEESESSSGGDGGQDSGWNF